VGENHGLELHGLTSGSGSPGLPCQLPGTARVRSREIEQVLECLLLRRLAGRVDLEIQVYRSSCGMSRSGSAGGPPAVFPQIRDR
jgi:hypothetical protein